MCSCLPPELDLFGIILYSVLTFMAAVSMLIYIEECIYIYKKVPSNKKSVIIWVNGAAPVSLTHGRGAFKGHLMKAVVE